MKRVRYGSVENQRIYWVWCAMVQRCRNPNCRGYVNYGARGITVDSSWDSFSQFYADMGARPSPAHTLERIDNDGPYSPNNCAWVERSANNLNKRKYKTNPSGLRCIEPRRDHPGYRVRVRRGGVIVFDRTLPTIDAAVTARDSYLSGV